MKELVSAVMEFVPSVGCERTEDISNVAMGANAALLVGVGVNAGDPAGTNCSGPNDS